LDDALEGWIAHAVLSEGPVIRPLSRYGRVIDARLATYPRLRTTALALAERFKPDAILIEDTSADIALNQELRQAGTYAVRSPSQSHSAIEPGLRPVFLQN